MRVISFLICWAFLLYKPTSGSQCGCDFQSRNFDTKYQDSVFDTCRKCFTFQYSYFLEQNWTARLCVETLEPGQTPLLVTARQSVSSISFNVPLTLKGESGQYSRVCRTLCPISNHGGNMTFMNGTQQNIVLDFWSKSPTNFEFEVQILQNFIIGMNSPMTLNLTVSEPAVLQYNLPGDLNSVRVQASSDTNDECMILSIEDIECPFHDTHDNVQQGGYRQSHTKKSAILVKRNTHYDALYIVLLLNPHDQECKITKEGTTEGNRTKEVTVEVVPVSKLSSIWYEIWVPALVILILGSFFTCCYQNCCKGDFKIKEPDPASPNNEEEYRMLHYVMSDMVEEKPWSSKSYTYCWNLGVISIFYALPAIQLVYLSHTFMYKTGNLDECYYNFLCANPLKIGPWLISDFNHVWSNTGYIILGIIFNVLVWIQEYNDPDSPRNVKKRTHILLTQNTKEKKGIPCHYGMFYALGSSLVIEGLMSATYHICPKNINFQFDTTFMYVICTLCIMKLFYGRHQVVSPKAHSFWMMVALSVFIPFMGIFSEILFWVLFILWAAVILIVTMIYVASPKTIEFTSGKFNCIKVRSLKGGKSYANQDSHCRFIAFGWFLIILAIPLLKFLANQDMNTILLAFYIINVAWYTAFYIRMKIRQSNLPDEYHKFREDISCHSYCFGCFAVILMLTGVFGFFISNNVEWSTTPALSRAKNQECYHEFNYYDKHDIWHFLSAFGLFFHFMFLLTVDSDVQDKPISQIAVF